MTTHIEAVATSILLRLEFATANLDPEILQWPGGGLFACILWIYLMAQSFWSVGVGAGGSAALSG
jgi:hypothetical protein